MKLINKISEELKGLSATECVCLILLSIVSAFLAYAFSLGAYIIYFNHTYSM